MIFVSELSKIKQILPPLGKNHAKDNIPYTLN